MKPRYDENQPIVLDKKLRTLDLADFLRMGHVKRWHTVNTSAQQTLADHSFMVMLIAMDLYDKMHSIQDNPTDALCLLTQAMFHDVHEVVMGDMPTTAKPHTPINVMAWATDHLLPVIPYTMTKESERLGRFIKMADVLDAAFWIEQHGVGPHCTGVKDGCWRRVDELVRAYEIETDANWRAFVDQIIVAYSAGVDRHG